MLLMTEHGMHHMSGLLDVFPLRVTFFSHNQTPANGSMVRY